MGLLDRINEINGAQQSAAIEEITRASVARQEVSATRRKIVTDAVQAFAAKHGCTLKELAPQGVSRYFLLDEFVIAVQEQPYIDKSRASTTDPHDVLWQHFVYLACIDRTARMRLFKIGTLLMLNFEGIRTVYNEHPGYDFDQAKVVPILFQV